LERKCPKCSHEMAIGFLLDRGHTSYMPLQWIDGAPEFSWTGSVKYQNRPWAQTETWVCKSCGYLESYALLKKDT
jgi:hypothetical protein